MWFSFSSIVLVLLLSIMLLGAYTLLQRHGPDPLTAIPGPKRKNLLWGYSRILLSDERSKYIAAWQKEYGNVLRVPTAFGGSWIMVLDVKAIHYMVSTNADNFQRPARARQMFQKTLGGGILASEGEDHKRLRKAMSPGFSPSSIRYFTSLFLEIAQKAKNHWLQKIELEGRDEIIIDVEPWLNDISFDSMGQAGFAHSFNAVDGSKPLVEQLFNTFGGSKFAMLIRLFKVFLRDAPLMRWLPIGSLLTDRTTQAMTDIAREVMRDDDAKLEAQDGRRSLIASILKEENRMLSEDEVIAEMNTLILSAYQTTSTALTWCFHELSVNPLIQAKLREELQQFPGLTPQHLENELPYLDAVVKESLRLHPTIPAVQRAVMSPDRIPLSTPIQNASGLVVNEIDFPARVIVVFPIEPINRSSDIWGEDAGEFRPERWLGKLPEAVETVKGWNHLMTFLDGPRNCIGRNFAVAEIKAVLATFFRDFDIQPWKDGTDVKHTLAFFVRARNEGVKGLMLRVREIHTN